MFSAPEEAAARTADIGQDPVAGCRSGTDVMPVLASLAADLAELQAECWRLRTRNDFLESRCAQLQAELHAGEDARLRALQTQKLEAIGQLTGGIAHNLNNLLTVLRGGLHLLPGAAEPARRDRLIRKMDATMSRGAEMTRRLLAFARRQLLQPEAIDLADRAEALTALLAACLGPRITLEVRLARDLWPVAADRSALHSSLLNIADNARAAMRQGGRFLLSAANCPLPPQRAENLGLTGGAYVEIACTDTGTGMTPDVLARAFEPFFTTRPVGQGVGLGLPQVHGFAAQSGGAARLESATGAGTTVVLLLPRATAACGAAAVPA
jgi:signal transduction histidine kinase